MVRLHAYPVDFLAKIRISVSAPVICFFLFIGPGMRRQLFTVYGQVFPKVRQKSHEFVNHLIKK